MVKLEDIRELGVNELVKRLHESMSGFVVGMESVVGMNREAPPSEIAELRGHVAERLKRGEEITDNRRLISLLSLLSKDQAVLELIKDDAKEWLDVIDAVEKQMASRKSLSAAEAGEVKKIRKMSADLKTLIRGG